MKVPSVAGEPPLTTPLFRIEGTWHYRWPMGTRSRLTVPVQWLQLNHVHLDEEITLQVEDGSRIIATQSRYQTTFHLEPTDHLRRVSKGRSGDYIFVGVDPLGTLSLRRVTAQKLSRTNNPLKKALLLAGQGDDYATVQALLWGLGVEDPDAGLPEARLIVKHRSDGLIARELEAFEADSQRELPQDLSSVFDNL